MVVSASIGERVKRSERRQKTAYGGGIHKGGGSLPLCKLAFEVKSGRRFAPLLVTRMQTCPPSTPRLLLYRGAPKNQVRKREISVKRKHRCGINSVRMFAGWADIKPFLHKRRRRGTTPPCALSRRNTKSAPERGRSGSLFEAEEFARPHRLKVLVNGETRPFEKEHSFHRYMIKPVEPEQLRAIRNGRVSRRLVTRGEKKMLIQASKVKVVCSLEAVQVQHNERIVYNERCCRMVFNIINVIDFDGFWKSGDAENLRRSLRYGDNGIVLHPKGDVADERIRCLHMEGGLRNMRSHEHRSDNPRRQGGTR